MFSNIIESFYSNLNDDFMPLGWEHSSQHDHILVEETVEPEQVNREGSNFGILGGCPIIYLSMIGAKHEVAEPYAQV